MIHSTVRSASIRTGIKQGPETFSGSKKLGYKITSQQKMFTVVKVVRATLIVNCLLEY